MLLRSKRQYLRFQTKRLDHESGSPMGVFVCAYELLRSKNLDAGTEHWLEDGLRWFEKKVKAPKCLQLWENRRAICWYTDERNDAISRMWDLVSALEEEGIFVDRLRTEDPGIVIYEDDYQLAAKPRRRRSG